MLRNRWLTRVFSGGSLLGVGLLQTIMCPISQAEEQQRVLESPRHLGRGNTFVAALDSDDATKANPATLAETKLVWQLRWLELGLMPGQNSIDTITDLTSIDGSETAVTLLQKFQDKFGKRQSLRTQIMPLALRIMKFEFSPFMANDSYVDMRLPTTPEVTIHSDTMAGANVATAFTVGKAVSVGLNVRPMQRFYFAGSLAFADVVDFLPPTNSDISDSLPLKSGTAVGVDLGTTWTLNAAWRLGALIENLGYTSSLDGGKDAPPPIPQRISAGMMYRKAWNPWHLDYFVDVQDLANVKAYNPMRLIHLGSELGRNLWSRDHDLGLLLGLNEGYFTGGAFLDFWLARLDIVNYAVELGEYPGQRMDRRWGTNLRVATTW